MNFSKKGKITNWTIVSLLKVVFLACVDCREVRHLLVVSFDELYLRTNDLVTAYIICSQLIYEYKPALNSNLNSLNSFSFYPSSPKILYAKSPKLLPVIQVSKLPIRPP